jgi:DeoR/GlpR family transcriptional regulator of sugar metabolism
MDKHLIRAFDDGTVQLFVGTGLSSPPYPTSSELCLRLLEEKSFDYGEGMSTLLNVLGGNSNVSLEDAAEFFQIYRNDIELCRFLRDAFEPKETDEPRDVHKKLWRLPNTKLIYTTNFDCLIEDAIKRPKQPPRVVTNARDLRDIDDTERIVFKPHGCARLSSKKSEFVITRTDYLNYSYYKPLELLRTRYDLTQRTFLFLGYSLRDMNMRHIITEAHRLGAGTKAYAVMTDVSGPEARYWKQLNVTLVQMAAEQFIDKLLSCFALDESEWADKVGERITEKRLIARKAVDLIQEEIAHSSSLNILVDAGSTCLYVAKMLIERVLHDQIPSENVTIFTNSAPIIAEISQTNIAPDQCLQFISIGGPLKYATQAFVYPSGFNMKDVAGWEQRPGKRTIAVIGVTSIDPEGLKTRTRDELPVKKAFIEAADEVYVLADHSKISHLTQGICFSSLSTTKMTIITDRKESYEKEFQELVKAVR